MLYIVYCEFGFVGVFSSNNYIVDRLFNRYPDIKFIIYVFSNIEYDSSKEDIWIIYYKDSENVAYVSQDKNEAERVLGILQLINKGYEDPIDHWKTQVNTIPDLIINLLRVSNSAMQDINKKNNVIIDNTNNIITL